MNDEARKLIDFSVFLIHRLAERWGRTPAQAYGVLARAGAIENYILPFYDVLHTQGEECLTDELTRYVQKRGVSI